MSQRRYHHSPTGKKGISRDQEVLFTIRVQNLVLADSKTKNVLARRVVDWAISEFGGHVGLLSSQEIVNAAAEGIRCRLELRESEIQAKLNNGSNKIA